jgi:c-di-GMP-binding flagellar brake protein YcgR
MPPKSHVGIAKFEKDLERRTHPRFLLNLPIEYYSIDSPTTTQGHTLNASQGGLMVCLQEALQKGQHINLKLYFSSGAKLFNVETKAEVIWVDANRGEDGNYRYGVKFVNISLENHDRLKNFLNGLSPDLMT